MSPSRGHAFWVIVCFAAKANAQTTFASRETFLAADSSVVRASLGAIALGDSAILDRLVRADIPLLSRFFDVSPDVFWADGQGSSSHPSAGIGLDRLRLNSMRASLGATSAFGDVVFFILAHEFAHMAQFRRYPMAELSDDKNRKLVECQADLWAGALMEILLTDSVAARFAGQPRDSAKIASAVDQDFSRIIQSLSLAYQIGSPRWDSAANHPTAGMRGLCVAHGVRMGIQLGRIRDYQSKPSAERLEEIRKYEAADSTVLRLGVDPWAWSKTQAAKILTREVIPKIDLITPLKTLLADAEKGAQQFSESASRGLPSMECSYTNTSAGAELSCADSVFSAAMQRDTYNSLRIMVRAALQSRGWSEPIERTGDGTFTTYFEFADRRATVTVSYASTDARFKLVYLRITSQK